MQKKASAEISEVELRESRGTGVNSGFREDDFFFFKQLGTKLN